MIGPFKNWTYPKKRYPLRVSQFATLIWGLHTSFPAKKEAACTSHHLRSGFQSLLKDFSANCCPLRMSVPPWDLHRRPRGVKHRRKPVFSGTGGPKIFLKRWEKATSRLWRWKGFWNLKKSSWKGAQYSPKKILQQEINQAKKNMFHKPVGSFCF